MEKIFQDVLAEVERSNQIHGDNLKLPSLDVQLVTMNRDNERLADHYEIPTESRAKQILRIAEKTGTLTHCHIVVEELCEAVACGNDEEKMRVELIQLAATVFKWINAIDSRNA